MATDTKMAEMHETNENKATSVFNLTELEFELDDAIAYHAEFENLEVNGPGPMPNFHDNIGWEEANYEGMIDAAYEALDESRNILKDIMERAKGTILEERANKAYAYALSRQNAREIEEIIE